MVRHTPFELGAAATVGWEAAAYVTEALHEVGRLDWRVPYITEMVRALPTPARLLFYTGLGVVLFEHFERMILTRKTLGLCQGLLARGGRVIDEC